MTDKELYGDMADFMRNDFIDPIDKVIAEITPMIDNINESK